MALLVSESADWRARAVAGLHGAAGTLPGPTPPGPPSAPWAMLASDESMSIKFNPVVDTGGDAISKYQLFMRDAVVKGMYVQVYSGFYLDTIRVGQKQFPGMTENRQFQLKARAINDAGAGAFSSVGIASTTDLCDLTYACSGGNALVLDWSACAANMKGNSDPTGGASADPSQAASSSSNEQSQDIIYRLIELIYDKKLRSVEYNITKGEY